MFSQKKSFFQGKLFYILLIGIFAFGIWINNGQADLKDQKDLSTNGKQSVKALEDGKKNRTSEKEDNILDNIISKEDSKTTKDAIGSDSTEQEDADNAQTMKEELSDYYLVKNVKGTITVFYIDKNGKESVYRSTDIVYSLLTKTDQKMFDKGKKIDSIQDVENLIQDFES